MGRTCQVCPTGWYWPDDGAKAIAIGSSKQTDSCTICPAGKYQDRTNQRMCHSCPPGHFRSTAGATRAADCIKCNMDTLQLRKVPSAADPSVLEFVCGAKSMHEACAPKDSDCLMGPWSEPTRCSKVCGGGIMTRKRTIVRQPSGNGKKCPAVNQQGFQTQNQSCNTSPCSGLDTRYPLYEELVDGSWWELKFDKAVGRDIAPAMTAECRWQKNVADGSWAFIPNAENIVLEEDGTEKILAPGVGSGQEPHDIDFSKPKYANRRLAAAPKTPYLNAHPMADRRSHDGSQGVVSHVEGWCCRATSAHHRPMGKSWCYETSIDRQNQQEVMFWGTAYTYSTNTGKMFHQGKCAQFKPLVVHKRRCKSMTCKVEKHTCTKYDAAHKGICETSSTLQAKYQKQGGAAGAHPSYCPNAGWGNCKLAPGVTHTSIRVTHANDEAHDGHFCAATAAGTCECYCHNIYRNLAQSPHFDSKHNGLEATKQNAAKYGRNICNTLPASGKGAKYNAFTTTSPSIEFEGHTYRPVGPCKGVGCDVVRGHTYSSSCDLSTDGLKMLSPALRKLCEDSKFAKQKCMSPTRSSQCALNLLGNGGERASFFRVMNNLGPSVKRQGSKNGANYVPKADEGLYFYDYKGTELLHIRPNGPEFQVRNDFNYFGAVPEATAYAFLKGGGASEGGGDYTGMVVSFFSC